MNWYWRARAPGGPSAQEQPDTATRRVYGKILMEYKRGNIRKELSYDPKIRDCKYVASYNWREGSPTIIVPGKPRVWFPPITDSRLEPDQGSYPRDPNTVRYPTYPMEPAVRAVFKQNPEFPTGDVDIFTCSIVLGNLSRFARGVEKEFRFDMEKVGDTVFFIHREKYVTAPIPNIHGYGHTFPKEYTSWEGDVQGSEFHQRVIQYRLGGLCLLVRFGLDGYFRDEVDGYFRDEETLGTNSVSDSTTDASGEASASDFTAESSGGVSIGSIGEEVFQMEEIGEPIYREEETLGTISVSDSTTDTSWEALASVSSTGEGQEVLKVEEGGEPIPQEFIFIIKTRTKFDYSTRTTRTGLDLTDITPRLWVTQIPSIIVGLHDHGLFKDVSLKDVRSTVAEWEDEHKENIKKLAWLLHTLVDLARGSRTSLEVRQSEAGRLQIVLLANEPMCVLPPDLKTRWEAWSEAQAGDDEWGWHTEEVFS